MNTDLNAQLLARSIQMDAEDQAFDRAEWRLEVLATEECPYADEIRRRVWAEAIEASRRAVKQLRPCRAYAATYVA